MKSQLTLDTMKFDHIVNASHEMLCTESDSIDGICFKMTKMATDDGVKRMISKNLQ